MFWDNGGLPTTASIPVPVFSSSPSNGTPHHQLPWPATTPAPHVPTPKPAGAISGQPWAVPDPQAEPMCRGQGEAQWGETESDTIWDGQGHKSRPGYQPMGSTVKARPESGLGVGWYGAARFVGGGTRWGWSDLLVHSVPWGYAQHRLSCFLAQFLSTKTRLLAYHQLLKPASLAHLSLLTGSRECPWPEQLSQGFTMATPKSDSPPSHQKHNCIQENQGKFSSVSPACLPGRSLTLHCPSQIHSFFFPRWLTQRNLTTFTS